MSGEMNQLNNNQVTVPSAAGGMPVLGQTPTAPAVPAAPAMPTAPVAPVMPAAPNVAPAPVAPMPAAPAAPAMPTAPVASMSAAPTMPTPPTGNPAPAPGVGTSPLGAPGVMPNIATPGTIPSVAPTAPGAEPKPVQPVAETAVEPKKMTADDKRSNIMMIVLVAILVILIAVAIGLWWMNVQGISLFKSKAKPATRQEEEVVVPTPAPEVAESSAEASEDVCLANINAEGKRAIVEDFTGWASQYFTPAVDTDETYKGLFAYFLDRAALASGHCSDYNAYCETDFATASTFAAQFAHYDEQRSREPVSDYTTRVAASKLRDNMALNFNLSSVDLSSVVLDVNSQSQQGLDYNAADDTVAAFGPHSEPSNDYTFEFDQVLENKLENKVVLVGRAVASSTCKQANGCDCLDAQIHLLMGFSPAGDAYYMHEYVTPITE